MKGSRGKIAVSGFITPDGVGSLQLVSNHMNGPEYRQILEEGLLRFLDQKGIDPTEIIWVQDNNSKHTARETRAWFEDNSIECMDWPAQSPDMNIIEHIWTHLKRQIRRRSPPARNATELWNVVQEEWDAIDPEFIRHLYCSIPRRVEALHKAKGWWTKY